jgi:hypothetical protein
LIIFLKSDCNTPLIDQLGYSLQIGLVLSIGTFPTVIQFGSVLPRQVFSAFLSAHRARGILYRDLLLSSFDRDGFFFGRCFWQKVLSWQEV